MNKEDIIEICSKDVKRFIDLSKDLKYKKGGIFNSEMFLFVSLINHLNVKLIIESGRANGQSKKLWQIISKITIIRL